MVENVIHNKSVIIINSVAGAKIPLKIVCATKIIFGILLHVVENDEYLVSIINDSVVMWDKIIDAEAKS